MVDEFTYAAQSCPHERRAITRLERGARCCNPCYIATNLGD